MYSIIWFISKLTRGYLLPNPFECFNGKSIEYMGIEIPIIPELLMVLIEPLLIAFTYKIVGFYYSRAERKPAKGSILFLMFYSIHIFIISLLSRFDFSKTSIVLSIIGYFLLHVLIVLIKNSVSNLSHRMRSF